MPKVLEDRRQAIARNNPKLPKSSTYAIATSALQKEGKLPKKRYAEGGQVDRSEAQKQAAIREANSPDNLTNRREDEKLRAINDYLSPPGPREGSPRAYCKGGKVLSTRSW